MKAYKVFPSERREFKDRVSGVNITQLTSYLGHSNHAYFTSNGWFDNNQRLLFCSDRDNTSNLFSIHVESGEISQMTDFSLGGSDDISFTNDVNPKRPEVYYRYNKDIFGLNLNNLESRLLYSIPEGFNGSCGLVGADGEYIYGVLTEDLSNRIYADLNAGYIGMRDIFYAKPDCRIIRINIDTKAVDTLWQENCWVGHVNPSPREKNLITFCHEGPWGLVDHRIWVMDITTGKPFKLRERMEEGEKIGHEYWHADGVTVGYQVHKTDGSSYFGKAFYDGTNINEAKCVSLPSPDHIHSNDFKLIASDSGKCIKLYNYNGKTFDKARVLAMHDGNFFYGKHHPHPRFTADGKKILYNSNVSGYCNIYLADIPKDINKLPELEK